MRQTPRPYSILELPTLTALWERACESPRGIKIFSSNPRQLVGKLSAVRKDSGQTRYTAYAVCGREDSVWLVPKEMTRSILEAKRDAS
jgi:hypothetical protein